MTPTTSLGFNGYDTLRDAECYICLSQFSIARRRIPGRREFCPDCHKQYAPNVSVFVQRNPEKVARLRAEAIRQKGSR